MAKKKPKYGGYDGPYHATASNLAEGAAHGARRLGANAVSADGSFVDNSCERVASAVTGTIGVGSYAADGVVAATDATIDAAGKAYGSFDDATWNVHDKVNHETEPTTDRGLRNSLRRTREQS